MKLFDKVFHWNADDSLFTQIISILSVAFGVVCLGWLIVASYGIGSTKLAQAHTAGHGGSETIFATIIYAAAAFWVWINVTDRVTFRVTALAFAIVTLLLIIIGVNANTGFFAHVY